MRRRLLWEDLRAINSALYEPWFLAGDFNAILHATERKGGADRRKRGCPKFNDFMFDTGLKDLGFSGPPHTWSRGSLFQRLDRALCNSEWLLQYPQTVVTHLPRIQSDHRPLIVLSQCLAPPHCSRPFRFLAPWLKHPSFNELIHSHWKEDVSIGNNVEQLTEVLKVWNREVFGRIEKRKKHLLARIGGIQKALSNYYSHRLVKLEKELTEELEEVLEQEEELWFQKSRSDWIRFGDLNTEYYHARTISRRKANKITALQINGEWTDDVNVLKEEAIEFFTNLYKEEEAVHDTSYLTGCFPLLPPDV